MKKHLVLVLSSAALLLSTGVLVWTLTGLAASAPPMVSGPSAEPSAPADANAAYALEKLNEVSDMVLRREGVPEDYFRFLPEGLAETMGQYNADTYVIKAYYGAYAVQVVTALLYEHNEDPGDYLRGELFYSMVERISTLALYGNAEALCRVDPILSYTLVKESGGSYGMWAYRFHEADRVGEEMAQRVNDYFTMLDGLFEQLDAARAALN